MAAARRCSECGKSLEGHGPRALTCSNACRLKRSRRVKRARDAEEQLEAQPGGASIGEIVRREAPDAIERIMRDELRPVVREAIDEEVLRAIDDMVGLTPSAVAALQEDLLADDKVIRQRAYSLVIKYTLGNPNVAPPREDSVAPLQINFNLPRPEQQEPLPNDIRPLEDVLIADGVELQTCDMCHLAKPLTEFVAGSDRCAACMVRYKTDVMAKFMGGDSNAVGERGPAPEVPRDAESEEVHTGVRRSDADGHQAPIPRRESGSTP